MLCENLRNDASARQILKALLKRYPDHPAGVEAKQLMTVLDRLAPEGAGWSHDSEGPDDMPAHVKTMLTATSLHIPVLKGELALGTWQAIYLIEHRTRPHRREIVLQFAGATC